MQTTPSPIGERMLGAQQLIYDARKTTPRMLQRRSHVFSDNSRSIHIDCHSSPSARARDYLLIHLLATVQHMDHLMTIVSHSPVAPAFESHIDKTPRAWRTLGMEDRRHERGRTNGEKCQASYEPLILQQAVPAWKWRYKTELKTCLEMPSNTPKMKPGRPRFHMCTNLAAVYY
ncbi:hypothetical protein AG1IA_06483 [Rhizoctonia solani AG-1 IA]|uniref:Uncharacterized protein n=1 Tax=Thanatephorus cucumeris (strain AG1-IA) TaxID=983506 RepID=L8WRW5_THACA|nr:hypothetical protein AG1IA_06483 [Rhizoctonia solani AG-1 IA]